ncbi:MAG: MFS transporter [Novosphingobium sp.]|nr:MFS transporter [Novosphingobium sp.]
MADSERTPGATGEQDSPGASLRSFWPIIIALWIAEAVGSFETAMIFAAQRALTEHLGDPIQMGWLITSYLLVGAGAAALAGRLGDLLGRRKVILLILGAGLVGSLLSALAPNYALLLAGRCIQGLTGAILALCVGLVRENLPGDKVALGIGFMISGASAGTAGGLVIGGLIVDTFSWQAVFLASAVFAAIAIAGIRLCVPKSPVRVDGKRIDWFGGVLFVPAIFAILAAITYAPSWGFTDVKTLAAAGLGILLLALWIRVSLRTAYPLFDVRLFADRQVAIANGVTALVSMSSLQVTLVFSLLLQAPRWTMVGLGVSATVAGLVKLPSNISSLTAGPLSGWLTSRYGGRISMVTGGVICALGWLLAMAFHDSIPVIVAVLIVISFGTTILFAVGPTVLATAVPPDRTSEAAGTMTVVRQAFMGIGAQLMTVLLATETVASPDGSSHYPSASAFMLTMGAIALLTGLGTALALTLPRDAGRLTARPAQK